MHVARRRTATLGATLTALAVAASGISPGVASAADDPPGVPEKTPVATGYGGAVTSVDPEASRVGSGC